MHGDTATWTGRLTVEKFDEDQTVGAIVRTGLAAPKAADFARLGMIPRETIVGEPNLITTAGLGRLATLLVGSGQAASNTATRIGVGNSTTAAAITDVDLAAASGSSNRYFMTMDATYPSASAAVVTVKATFASADGNFAWQEWCIDVGSPTVAAGTTVGALMLNRKVQSLGTKSSGTSWVATATITFS